jgi:hypothetical protein
VSAPPPPPWPPRLDTWLDYRRADSAAPLAIEVLAAKEVPKPGTARIAEHAQRALHPCSAHRMQSDASYVARRIAEYEREDYQTPALLEVRILADSVSGCRYRWLALPPRSRAVCRIGVAVPVMVFPPGCGAVALAVQPVVPPYGCGVNVSSRIL